jgi:hypothetical protein
MEESMNDISKRAADALGQIAANHPDEAFTGEDVRAIVREFEPDPAMSDKKEITVVNLRIELPADFVGQLPEVFWTRLELIISSLFRLNEPKDSDLFPNVWKES